MERYEEDNIIDDEEGNTIKFYYAGNSIYDYPSQFMVSCWGIDSYFNDEKIKLATLKSRMLHLVHSDILYE